MRKKSHESNSERVINIDSSKCRFPATFTRFRINMTIITGKSQRIRGGVEVYHSFAHPLIVCNPYYKQYHQDAAINIVCLSKHTHTKYGTMRCVRACLPYSACLIARMWVLEWSHDRFSHECSHATHAHAPNEWASLIATISTHNRYTDTRTLRLSMCSDCRLRFGLTLAALLIWLWLLWWCEDDVHNTPDRVCVVIE